MTYDQETGKYTCEFCGEYTEEDKRKVHMHQIHCKKKVEGADQAGDQNPDDTELPSPPRRERVPFGVPQRKFNAPENDGFNYRVFNDSWRKEPGRIQRALNAGYEVVEGREAITVGTNEDGSPIKGVLMRIPKELYEEDQKLKQKEVDKVDIAIKGGTLEQQAGDKRYIPQGIQIYANSQEPG